MALCFYEDLLRKMNRFDTGKLKEPRLSLCRLFANFIAAFFFCFISNPVCATDQKITCPSNLIGSKSTVNGNAPVNAPLVNIKDDLTHQKMRRILADVRDFKEGRIGAILQKFSGRDSNWVWTVKEQPLDEGINASTLRTIDGVVSLFDYNKLRSASRISIARTFIHELVHTYLLLYFRYDSNASKEYPDIKEEWLSSSNPDLNEIHHAEMARSFVHDIAIALKEYAHNTGGDYNDTFYDDLAWAGLDYQDNDELKQKDKFRIQQTIRSEQLGTDTVSSL